ncbi:MAG: aminotransferase [Pseudomonadota bacterium]
MIDTAAPRNNIEANSIESCDIQHVLHPFTNLALHRDTTPLVIDRGDGVWVYDSHGKAYIEGISGLWCTSLGHGNRRLIEAATRQLEKLPYAHLFASQATEPAARLAEALIKAAPAPMDKVFFASSGSEANDTVIKIVRYYNNARGQPKRKKIIARHGGYHGVTLASASLTGLVHARNDFDLPIEGILHTARPHYYRDAHPGESEQEFSARLADELEALILQEGRETVAAFIAEPVMAAGGVIMPPEGYFERITDVLGRYGILFIADEVICGFGRLGTMWGSQAFGLKPDMVTCAKALSSAYLPISAVMVSKEIADVIAENSARHGSFGHGYTYTGHPVAAAVALEVMAIYQDEDILGHVAGLAPVLARGFQRLADHRLVGDQRSLGMIGAVELVRDKETKAAFDPGMKLAARLGASARDRGLMVRPLAGDIVALCPPLVIDQATLELVFERFASALDDVWAEVAQ